MAIGTPVALGSANVTGSSNPITTGAAVPTGSLILVVAGYATVLDTLTSVTDSVGNVYTVIENDAGTGIGVSLAYCANCISLTNIQVITANFSGSTVNSVACGYVPNVAPSSPLDTSGHSSTGLAATSASSVATGTLAMSDEIVIGIVGTNASTGLASSTGFTNLKGQANTGATIRMLYDIVAATTSVAWAPSWSTAANYASAVFSFKGIAAGLPDGTRYDLTIPAPRRYPMENRGFVHDMDLQLIGQDQTPKFIPNLDLPAPVRRINIHRDPQAQYVRIVGNETLPKFTPDLTLPQPRKYPMENRGFLHDMDLHLIGKDVVPNFVPDLRIPPAKPFLRNILTWLGQDDQRVLLIGQETLPKFTPDWKVIPPRPVPAMELRGFIKDLDVQLIGQDQLPNFTVDWSIPRARPPMVDLRTWIGQQVQSSGPIPPPIVVIPAPPSGGIGMRRFGKHGRLRYPEEPRGPFEGYTTEQLQRIVEAELPQVARALRPQGEAGAAEFTPLDVLPPLLAFDFARARALEVGAGLILAELRARKSQQDAAHEEDELIAMLLLFS